VPQTPYTQFLEQNVDFLREQDGAVERELKSELCCCFRTRGDVERAYLAVVHYIGKNTSDIALCLVAKPGTELGIVREVGAVFSRMFNSNEHLDILFANESQEQRLLELCKPFFARTPKE
jgi:hypothetical protein